METAIIWGWLLTMQTANMPPIIDVNYKTEAECEAVKSEVAPRYPNYTIYCTPTYKPETIQKPKRKRVATRYRSRSRR
jgi:hypothetical protein